MRKSKYSICSRLYKGALYCVASAWAMVAGAINIAPELPQINADAASEYNLLYRVNVDDENEQKTKGLGLRLHYDSTKVSDLALSNVYAIASLGVAASQEDVADYDNDATTDRFVLLSWFDIDGNWPGVAQADLFTLTLNTRESFSQDTSINLTTRSANEQPVQVASLFVAPNEVHVVDADEDGVADVDDAFVNNAAASKDTDGDGQPDDFHESCDTVCISNSGLTLDLDDDNDGYTDEDEIAAQTDGLSAGSIPADNDGDFISDVTDLDDDNDGILDTEDSEPFVAYVPTALDKVLEHLSLHTLTINATDELTDISSHIPSFIADIEVGEGIENDVVVVVYSGGIYRRSGNHVVEVLLENGKEDAMTANVEVIINPLVEIAPLMTTSNTEVVIPILLLGEAPSYPITFSLQMSSGLDLEETEVQLFDGTMLNLDATILDTTDVQTLIIVDAQGASLGNDEVKMEIRYEDTVDTEPLSVSASLLLDDKPTALLANTDQEVAVQLLIENYDVYHPSEYVMSFALQSIQDGTNSALNMGEVALKGHEGLLYQLTLPELAEGKYELVTTVNVADLETMTVVIPFRVNFEIPTLDLDVDSDNDGVPDGEEGYGDADADGIPDYLDDAQKAQNESNWQGGEVTAQDGTSIKTGDLVSEINQGLPSGIGVSIDEVETFLGESITEANVQEYQSPLIDFAVAGLAQGETVAMVLPLPVGVVLSNRSQYRKFDPVTGWKGFVVNNKNFFQSGQRVAGQCPELTSGAYRAELNAGDDCVVLHIEDGGPNDSDGEVNGIVVDPGVFAIINNAPSIEVTLASTLVNEGELITLNLVTSDSENDELTVRVEQLQGSVSLISGQVATSGSLGLVAPAVSSDEVYNLEFVVSDGDLTARQNVSFVVKNVITPAPAPNPEPTPTTPTNNSGGDEESGGGGSTSFYFAMYLAMLILGRRLLFEKRHLRY